MRADERAAIVRSIAKPRTAERPLDFLKHLTSAVRAYRIADPVGVKRVEALTLDDLLPTIAVVPFSSTCNDQRHLAMGDALADDVIAALSRSSGLKVVARLSTNVFRRPLVSLPEIRSHLGAAYALCGSYSIEGNHLRLRAEFVLHDFAFGIDQGEDCILFF